MQSIDKLTNDNAVIGGNARGERYLKEKAWPKIVKILHFTNMYKR